MRCCLERERESARVSENEQWSLLYAEGMASCNVGEYYLFTLLLVVLNIK